MKLRIPQGGFFVAKYSDNNVNLLNQKLTERGLRTLVFSEENLVFAAFEEFEGQGMWSGKDGAVAYDLNLTNLKDLEYLVPEGYGQSSAPGEMLWQLYRCMGLDFLNHLRGQFGFALWDGIKKSLLVVTDPYGIRSVVYSQSPQRFIAASRIRQLFIDPNTSREINFEAIYHYFNFSAIPSPISIYKNINKLDPGNCLIVKNNKFQKFVHYDIRYRPDHSVSKKHWLETIPREVERAVANYIALSDPEKTGCFLSGGTDSSSVSGYYTKLTGSPAKTFSIGFKESDYNELDFAYIASRHFGTEQHDYIVTPEDVLGLIENISEIYDEPFGNSSVVPAYYCAKMAKENAVDVLLAGDGGDEIFGGNKRYADNLMFELYSRVPKQIRRLLIEPFIKILPENSLSYKASRYVRRANIPNPDRFFSYNLLAENDPDKIFQPGYLSEIDTDSFINLVNSHYKNSGAVHVTDRLLYIDMKLTITDNDLRKVTQMAEAADIRVGYPLLDRDLVDFAATIPPTLKVMLGKERYIFKRAMTGFLPIEIINKKKQGMGLPIAPWFKKNSALSQLLNDTLFSQTPRIADFVRLEFLNKMKSAFELDTTSYYGSNFWVFLMMELWARKFL